MPLQRTVDLEARVRSLMAAIAARDPEAILGHLAPGVRHEIAGGPALGRDGLAASLRASCSRIASIDVTVAATVPRRNVTFTQWSAAGALHDRTAFATEGVLVLSWDQDGLVAHVTAHARADATRGEPGAPVGPFGLPA